MTATVHTPHPPREGLLSHAERLIWATEHATIDLPFLECPRHLAIAVRVKGPLDAIALRRSLEDIAQRHSVLRSRFVARHGEVTRVISPDAGPLLEVTSIDESPYAGILEGEHLVREAVNAPFAPGDGLLRARLLTSGAGRAALVVTVHHLVADGWSLRILARELETGYARHAHGQASSMPPLAAQYADYVAWQQERLTSPTAAQLAVAWREQFAGAPDVRISADLPLGNVPSTRSAQHTFAIGPDRLERLHRLAAAHRTTVGVAALACFVALVADVSGERDVIVGVPVWDRPRPVFEELIGLFMNALPVRVTMPSAKTSLALLTETRDQFRRTARYSSLPYPWLRATQVGSDERAAVRFRFVFNFAAIDGTTVTLPGTICERIDVFAETPACADLSVHLFQRGPGCAGLFIYKADCYSAAFIASLAERYANLVTEMGDQIDACA
jgi:hypothetical protein